MAAPGVNISKKSFSTGSTPPSAVGVLAIIAAATTAAAGPNVPAKYARDDLVLNDFGHGPLTEYASYCLQVGQSPVIPVLPASISQASSYSTFTSSAGTGSSTCTGASGVPALDSLNLLVQFTQGVTVGQSGGLYTYSFDGGLTVSAPQSLPATVPALASFKAPDGTALAAFSFSAGTIAPGSWYQSFASRAQPNSTDIAATLTALANTKQIWEGVFIDSPYVTGTTVSQIDTWLAGLEAKGQFHFALLSTRHKTRAFNGPGNTVMSETEAAFATAMQTLTGTDVSERTCVGTDAGAITSTLTGISQQRPTALFLAARAMLIPVGEDPAFTGRGQLTGVGVSDQRGNPFWHDEYVSPTLDGLRLVTLTTFAPNSGNEGVYITNANVLSSGGSDFVWLQHLRVMNLACTVAFQVLSKQLSIGVAKGPKDPVTGVITIAPEDADRINGLVNAQLTRQLKGQCTAVDFELATDDDLSSNSSSLIHGTIQVESLAYLKQFSVTASFAKTITAKAA
jgi:Protein of unknown function (DUF2586)